MTKSAIIIAILLLLDISIKIWYARYFRKSAKFWENHSEHWRRMFEKEKYGTKYKYARELQYCEGSF